MAKYTELFKDYIDNGGELPFSFSLIEGFKTLFIKHFCDCEIGFETEALFAIKLDARADMIMSDYKRQIDLTKTCIHLVHSGYRNEQYEDYQTQTISLPCATYLWVKEA